MRDSNKLLALWRVSLAIIVVVSWFYAPLGQQPAKAAIPAGFSEYYLPGNSDDLMAVLQTIDTSSVGTTLTNVTTISVGTDNVTIYYDHWENGYTSGTSGDEVYTANKGTVLTFKSTTIPYNSASPRVPASLTSECTLSTFPAGGSPAGASNRCYDGRDRIYVAGGAVSVAQAFWPTTLNTNYANAWEIYPIKPYQKQYIIPVGENLYTLYGGANSSFNDFLNVFVLVQATSANTNIQIDDPETAGVEVNVTRNQGQTTRLDHIWAGTTVTADKPVQVQFIVGEDLITPSQNNSRSYTAVPSSLWSSEYYSPVPGPTNAAYQTDLFIYNPTSTALTINYQDTTGSGSFVVAANSTESYQQNTARYVPTNSGVYLAAADGKTKFWAIGSVDAGNPTYNWGFTLIPPDNLTKEYFVSWAPGGWCQTVVAPCTTTNAPAQADYSPVFVTPIQNNTTVYVDYSPADGLVDATYTLDRIHVQRVYDQAATGHTADKDNSGMHIWSTAPIAIVWGQDPNTSAAAAPGLDAGYTILPFNQTWIDVVVTLSKTASPSSIAPLPNQESTFSVVVHPGAYGLDGVYVSDVLPANWAYELGSSKINGVGASDPTGGTGPNLAWGSAGSPLASLGPNEPLTLTYKAKTTAIPANYSVNFATVTGTYGGNTFSAENSTTVVSTSPDLTVLKTNDLAGNALVGTPFHWNFNISNGSSSGMATFADGQNLLTDELPIGPTYGTVEITNGDIPPTGSIICVVSSDVLTCKSSGSAALETGASLIVSLEVTPNAAGPITNPRSGGVCKVDPDAVVSETDETNNTCSTNAVAVVPPSLSVTKTSTPTNGSQVLPGATIDYMLTIQNTGGLTQNYLQVSDPLPTGTAYVAQSTVVTGYAFTTQSVADNFESNSFSGGQDSNAAADPSWNPSPGSWTETDTGGLGAAAGSVQIVTESGDYSLRIQNTGRGVARNADLSSCAKASLSLDVKRGNLNASTDFVNLSIGKAGVATNTLLSFAGPTNDANYQTYNVDITGYIDAQTNIKLLSSGMATTESIYFDNITISCDAPAAGAVIKDNIPGGANADITGLPGALLSTADRYYLDPGNSMTIAYQVVVNNPAPAGLASIDNTASVTSQEQLVAVHASTSHPLPDGVVGDRVWVDNNGNGLQDNGEVGLEGATVDLYQCTANCGGTPTWAKYASVTTDPSGVYESNSLPAGLYYTQFSAAGYTFTPADLGSGSNDSRPDAAGHGASFSLAASQTITNQDAGVYKLAAIGDLVWNDANANGIQDNGEAGIADVTVDLNGAGPDDIFGTADDSIYTTITNGSGIYFITDLTPGSYILQVTPPAGDTFSPTGAGTSATDSDILPATGKTASLALVSNQTDSTVDAGLFAADFGDLPNTYGTLLANDGARHASDGSYLGETWTAKSDGTPGPAANGDAADDGVLRTPNFNWNAGTGKVDVMVAGCSSGCYLSGWIDWNQNGDFNQAGEQVLVDVPVSAGLQTLSFSLPVSPLNESLYARFRLYPQSGVSSPTGLATGGEVEDYRWDFGVTSVFLKSFTVQPVANLGWLAAGLAALLALAAAAARRRG